MPIEVTRSRRQLTPDELALIQHWAGVYQRPILPNLLIVLSVMIGVLMGATLLASDSHPLVVIVFWLIFGAILFAWIYTTIRNEHDEYLSAIMRVDVGGKPAVMDIVQYDVSEEDVDCLLEKSDPFSPEPGDQLVITRLDGKLAGIEFVGWGKRIRLSPPVKD